MALLRTRSSESNSITYRFLDWLIAVLLCVAAACVLLFVAFTPHFVKDSAVNEVLKGDLVFVDKIGKYFFDYARGDCVAYNKAHDGGSEKSIGRIIAFGGEKITISNGAIYVDDALLDEKAYSSGFSTDIYVSFVIPDNSYLILPDDRSGLTFDGEEDEQALFLGDTDSPSGEVVHTDGLLFTHSEIIGEVRFRIYPLDSLELFV